MADPVVLILGALATVSTVAATMFRLLMAEKDQSYKRLDSDCEERYQDIREDRDWTRRQWEALQANHVAAIQLMRDAVQTQGVGVQRIIELLENAAGPHGRSES